MRYADFKRRFGRSARTKHVNSPIDTSWRKTAANTRMYVMPRASEWPAEFIRLDPWEAEYLFMSAARTRKGIVETGRFNGGSAMVMAAANPDVPIHSIDIAPQDDDRLRALIAATGVGGNVDLIVGDSQAGRFAQIGEVDMLFIDGDHSYAGCLADLENWWDHVVPGGHVLLHDCYHGCEVMEAVIDFVAGHDVLLYRSPLISAEHWLSPQGSIMHFAKRS